MTLDSASNMQPAFDLEVSLMGFFRSWVRAEVSQFAVKDNLSEPPVATGLVMRSKQLSFGSSLGLNLVLHVLRTGYIPEIANRIVVFCAVNMVNFAHRPIAIYIKKRESMSKVPFSTYPYLKVATGVLRSDNASCNPSAADCHSAGENTRVFAVVQSLLEMGLSKARMLFSHDTVPSLIGQKPRRVTSTPGLRHFNIGAA